MGDLKADGVDTTVAKSTAVIETVDENVVVEQLVDDEDATTASPTKGAGTTGKGSTKAAGKGSTKAAGKGSTKAPGKDATKAPGKGATTSVLSAATPMQSNPIFAV